MNSLARGFLDLLSFTLSLILPSWFSKHILPLTDHFAYAYTRYETYHTRIQTSDNSSIVLLFSSSPGTADRETKSHSVLFSFAPSKQSSMKPIRIERYPSVIRYNNSGLPLADGRQAFRLLADNFGVFFVGHEYQYYWLDLPDPNDETATLTISACLTERTPLKRKNILFTLYGTFVRLNSLLPSCWHIFSTRSVAKYMVTRRKRVFTEAGKETRTEEVILEGEGLAFIDKNWGNGLSEGWIRMQGFDPTPLTSTAQSTQEASASFALAGGKTGVVGLKAYLAAYHSSAAGSKWTLGAPWALYPSQSNRGKASNLSSSEYIKDDDNHPKAEIDLRSLTKRLLVRAETSEDVQKWLHFDYPLMAGRGKGKVHAHETFSSRIEVIAYRRPLRHIFNPNGWQVVDRRIFEDAAFKLGGNYRTDAMLKLDEETILRRSS